LMSLGQNARALVGHGLLWKILTTKGSPHDLSKTAR
jgi:hypothetical protein